MKKSRKPQPPKRQAELERLSKEDLVRLVIQHEIELRPLRALREAIRTIGVVLAEVHTEYQMGDFL